MIMCFNDDDLKVLNAGYKQQGATFGVPFCYIKGHSYGGMLKQDENLFITAHGNDQEIGNEGDKGMAFAPDALAKVLNTDILPGKYAGSLYVSACDSAPNYVNGLLAAMGAGYKGRIFGCKGAIGMAIKPPSDAMWIAAVRPAGAQAASRTLTQRRGRKGVGVGRAT